MNLEERYAAAGMDSYVGRVRLLQEESTTNKRGMNSMDGTPRQVGNNAPDEYQEEFTRSAPGTYRYGKNGNPGARDTTDYPLSRWTANSLKIAFDGVGPTTQPVGYFGNPRFTTYKGVQLHTYSPHVNNDFKAKWNTAFGRARATPGVRGPSPAGVNG